MRGGDYDVAIHSEFLQVGSAPEDFMKTAKDRQTAKEKGKDDRGVL